MPQYIDATKALRESISAFGSYIDEERDANSKRMDKADARIQQSFENENATMNQVRASEMLGKGQSFHDKNGTTYTSTSTSDAIRLGEKYERGKSDKPTIKEKIAIKSALRVEKESKEDDIMTNVGNVSFSQKAIEQSDNMTSKQVYKDFSNDKWNETMLHDTGITKSAFEDMKNQQIEHASLVDDHTSAIDQLTSELETEIKTTDMQTKKFNEYSSVIAELENKGEINLSTIEKTKLSQLRNINQGLKNKIEGSQSRIDLKANSINLIGNSANELNGDLFEKMKATQGTRIQSLFRQNYKTNIEKLRTSAVGELEDRYIKQYGVDVVPTSIKAKIRNQVNTNLDKYVIDTKKSNAIRNKNRIDMDKNNTNSKNDLYKSKLSSITKLITSKNTSISKLTKIEDPTKQQIKALADLRSELANLKSQKNNLTKQ